MKTKFKQSDICILGTIEIGIPNEVPGFGRKIKVDISGSKGKTKSGVYELVNKLNGKRYIGQARDLEIRHKRHINDLILGNHHSKLMQEDFNTQHMDRLKEFPCSSRYSFDADFEMRVIIYCRPSELTFYEHLLIKYLNPEYNIHKQKEIENLDSDLLNDILEDQKEFDELDDRFIN